MSFLTDKEELKPGLIIFRRADVDHRNFYCRIKLPKADRYKTISLRTPDISTAREKAFDHDADVRFRLKHDVPIFNRPFSDVAEEYVALQKRRAATGEISPLRVKKIASIIKAQLNPYVGTTQIHLIGHDRWENYPTHRRTVGQGRIARTGQTRPLTEDELAAAKAEAAAKAKAATARVISKRKTKVTEPRKAKTEWVFASDATISTEMSVFSGIMNYAATKRYIPVELSILRVATRVIEGGHGIDEPTLRKRFPKTQRAISEAVKVADASILTDNSRDKSEAFAVCRVQLGQVALYDVRTGPNPPPTVITGWMDRAVPLDKGDA
jgi:predicted ABC-type ATPase